MAAARFIDPPWEAPLDAERALSAVPADASLAGMFFLALAEGAQRRQVTLDFGRPRYLQFGFYPAREFAALLVQACRLFYPDLSLRHALRRIGRVGPVAFLGSTLGRVTLGASEGPAAMVSAIVKTYPINIKPSRCEIVREGPRSIQVCLDGVPYFLDSHHVGVFEGTLHYAGVEGGVKICSRTDISADFLLEW
jgi:uncharacterized protein (TIGR02265 family)